MTTFPLTRERAVHQAVLYGFPRRQTQEFLQYGYKYKPEQDRVAKIISPLIPTGALILIRGREGNGKTALACSYAYGWYLRGYSNARGKARYWTMTGLLNQQKSWYATKGGAEPLGEATECGLLVLDEILASHESPHDQNLMRDLLNARYAAKRTTILLTNLSDEGLAKAVDRPTLDRVRDGGALIEMRGDSMRGA